MKKKIMIFLTVLLFLPAPIYSHEPIVIDAPERITTFNKIISQFNHSWQHYTQCFRTVCSPAEKQKRWQAAQSITSKAIKAAIVLFVLIYAIQFTTPQRKALQKQIGDAIAKKRRTLIIK